MRARQDWSRLVPVVPDAFVDQQRRECAARILTWLQRSDAASVLSITSWDAGGRGGRPDRAYDGVAVETDLWRALDRLPELERAAAFLSKAADRDNRSWFRLVERELVRLQGARWHAFVVENPVPKPFEVLLSRAAELMTEDLGPGFW